MSAYMVSDRHLDYLISAGLSKWARDPGSPLRWYINATPVATGPRGGRFDSDPTLKEPRELTPETAARVYTMLFTENQASFNHRYPHHPDAGEPAEFMRWEGGIDPVQVLKSTRCYEYQACEHPEWETSEAKAFCEALLYAAMRALPGYEEAAWGAPGE